MEFVEQVNCAVKVVRNLRILKLLKKKDVVVRLDVTKEHGWVLKIKVIAPELVSILCQEMFQKTRDKGCKVKCKRIDRRTKPYRSKLTAEFYER